MLLILNLPVPDRASCLLYPLGRLTMLLVESSLFASFAKEISLQMTVNATVKAHVDHCQSL
ncbi:hypothetical protein B9Y78_09475 [Stenotrophomonas maltophilia]|jgi:hypothetical protein|nr:hypothetical protein A9K61_19095 [Stenotrophomonas maltophilia]PJL39188.1 hypothetical protein B9Y78_09475 [Stenotrophomonas maltophilia]